MSQLNEVTINEKETIYDIKMSYHSDRKCQNYDAIITGVEEANGSVTIRPWGSDDFQGSFFEFQKSDPDRVIAIAQMMMAFARTIKNEYKMAEEAAKAIDTSTNE